MATTPTMPTPAKRARKQNGKTSQPTPHRTISIAFGDKYASLYDELARAADRDDRPLSQYVLLFLRDNHRVEQPSYPEATQ